MSRKATDRRSVFVFLLALLSCGMFVGNFSAAGQEVKHLEPTNLDISLQCIDRLLGKLALASESVDLMWKIDPCPNSRAGLQEILNRDGLRLFDAGQFLFVIPAKFFPPPPPGSDAHWPQVKWSHIAITVKVKPAEGMSQELASQIGDQLLKRARLIPLDADFNKEGTVLLQLNIHLYDLRLSSTSPTRSIIAWVNQLPDGGSGRFVYGEMQDEKYVMLWDSPLFLDVGNPDFEDVNGDGTTEIVMPSHLCGNGCEDRLVIFDKDGRELTRQQNCGATEYGWVCDIQGSDISLENTADGKEEIQVSGGEDGKDHVFRLVHGVYVPTPPFSRPVSLADKDAMALNDIGIKSMKRGDYEDAATAFASAVDSGVTKRPATALYANNAGFAYYKLKRYQDAVGWFQRAISVDPSRAIAYLNLGDAYGKLNRNAEARQAYTKYLELAPNSKSAPDVKKRLAALPPNP